MEKNQFTHFHTQALAHTSFEFKIKRTVEWGDKFYVWRYKMIDFNLTLYRFYVNEFVFQWGLGGFKWRGWFHQTILLHWKPAIYIGMTKCIFPLKLFLSMSMVERKCARAFLSKAKWRKSQCHKKCQFITHVTNIISWMSHSGYNSWDLPK